MSKSHTVGGSHVERYGGVRYSQAFKILGPTPRATPEKPASRVKHSAKSKAKAAAQNAALSDLGAALRGRM